VQDILSDEQQAVLAVVGAPVLVEAGPGSGKTRTLVAKFLQLVAAGTDPERILVLTFSQKAAAEFRHRVELKTRSSVKALSISTFHSFGYDLLSRYPIESKVPRAYRLLTGFKEWVLVRDVLRKAPLSGALGHARHQRGLVSEVANAIGLLKHNLVSHEALNEAARTTEGDLLPDLAEILRCYETQLEARRHYDFRDLIGRSKALLEHYPEIKDTLFLRDCRWVVSRVRFFSLPGARRCLNTFPARLAGRHCPNTQKLCRPSRKAAREPAELQNAFPINALRADARFC
jgi:DNA helicase II / ATP-dependent DNA helicase PcrA